MHKMIALDTNMLLSIRQHKIDVFGECQELLPGARFVVPKQVLKELLQLKLKSKALEHGVNIALGELKKNNVLVKTVRARNADEALQKLSKEAVIATNDKELRKKIKQLNGMTIFLKKKKLLRME